MINLLPQTEKKVIQREYSLRRLVLVLIFVLVLILLSDILLFPSYVLMEYRLKTAQSSGLSQPDATETQERTTLSAELSTWQSMTTALNPSPIKPLPTDILGMIIKDKTSDNIINSFIYTQPAKNSYQVSVTGVARTRESLQAFVESLRHELGVTSVDLPISNFAKDTSIQFSFNVKGTVQ